MMFAAASESLGLDIWKARVDESAIPSSSMDLHTEEYILDRTLNK